MSEQEKPKNLCEEVPDPKAKDPNWVPPWEDLPVDPMREIIPGMLAEIHEKIKMACYLGTHSARHDLPEASNYPDGAFFIIPEERKFYMVINDTWMPFKSVDNITPIIETTQDAIVFAKKIFGDKMPPVWEAALPDYSIVNPPGIYAARHPSDTGFVSDVHPPGNAAAQTTASTTSVSDILSGTSVVTAMSLMESMGMSAKELVENSSVSESKPIVEVFGAEGLDPSLLEYRDGAVAEVMEAATALRDSGILTEDGIEGVVEITKTDTETTLSFGNMVPDPEMAQALPVTRSSVDPIVIKPAETIQPGDVPEPQPEPEPKAQEFAGENAGAVELLEENIRQVSVPIASDQLREYFGNKGIFYVVNYSESKLKGASFLNYLTNLNVPSDVKFNEGIGFEEYSEIMLAYMNQNSITNLALLNVMAAEMLLFAKGMPYELSPYALAIPVDTLIRFIDENNELVSKWLHFIDSTHVYGLYAIKCLNEHYKPAEFYEVIDDPEYVGRNIAQLYRIPEFIAYYFNIVGAKYHLSYFKPQFEEYMFKNERLSRYFRSKNNYACLMYEHLAKGTFKASDVGLGIFSIGVFDPAVGLEEYDGSIFAPDNRKEET